MNWSYRFTVVDVLLPVEKEVEWRAAVRLLLDALERVETEAVAFNNNPSPNCGVAQSGEGLGMGVALLENAGQAVDGTATGQILTA